MASTASVVRSGMRTFPRWQEQGSYPASPFEELVREQPAVAACEHEDQGASRLACDDDERGCAVERRGAEELGRVAHGDARARDALGRGFGAAGHGRLGGV